MCAFSTVKVEVGDGGRMTLIAMDGEREAFRLTFSNLPYGVIACPLCGRDFVEAKSLPDQKRKRPGLFDVLTVPIEPIRVPLFDADS